MRVFIVANISNVAKMCSSIISTISYHISCTFSRVM